VRQSSQTEILYKVVAPDPDGLESLLFELNTLLKSSITPSFLYRDPIDSQMYAWFYIELDRLIDAGLIKFEE